MTISEAFEALQGTFPSEQLALAGTEEYDKLNNSYYSFWQSDISPATIFLPKSKHDVAQFVQTFKPFALDGAAQFAIRGAGQQPLPGCSNIANGVTIDLRFLTGLELKDGCIAIGAGERWGTVYEKLTQEGLGVTGSRSSGGGIGGLALAGTVVLISFIVLFKSIPVISSCFQYACVLRIVTTAHYAYAWSSLRRTLILFLS